MAGENIEIGPHLLGIEGLSREQIEFYLDTAEQFAEIKGRSVKKVPSLRGKTVLNVFLEPSTRTRVSFEIAAKRLSADAVNLSGSSSSVTKGETLIDTALTLQSMAPDVVVLRHASSGSAKLISEHISDVAVVNAGDGLHEHPTQALLDALTIRQRLGTLEGLTVALVGDVLRSRVARSNIFLHRAFGNEVRVVAPPTLARREFEAMGARVFHSLAEGVADADVVMSLRMKAEYLNDSFVPSLDEYARLFCISERVLAAVAPDSIVLAPGPFQRGIEVDSTVIDGPRSVVSDQVANGVAVRMAVIFLLNQALMRRKHLEDEASVDASADESLEEDLRVKAG